MKIYERFAKEEAGAKRWADLGYWILSYSLAALIVAAYIYPTYKGIYF